MTGPSPRPARETTTSQPRPIPLTNQEVEAALEELRDWSGDSTRLIRTVGLPDGVGQAQMDRVRQAEQELNHHARIEQGPDGTTFTLWTHSCDCVTGLDVELARRINRALDLA